MPEEQKVRVNCSALGLEHLWIEYDVSAWGLSEFMNMPGMSIQAVVRRYLEQDSTNWHMVGDDGVTISHPGRGATHILWSQLYKQIGPRTGRAIATWMGLSCLSALGEAMQPDSKSVQTDDAIGEGGESGDAD